MYVTTAHWILQVRGIWQVNDKVIVCQIIFISELSAKLTFKNRHTLHKTCIARWYVIVKMKWENGIKMKYCVEVGFNCLYLIIIFDYFWFLVFSWYWVLGGKFNCFINYFGLRDKQMWKIGLSVLEKNEFLEHSTLLRFVRQYYLHTSPVETVNGRNQFTPRLLGTHWFYLFTEIFLYSEFCFQLWSSVNKSSGSM